MARPREFDADAVIDAAIDDFWGSSYASTSTDELCRSTGLSRSSLYNAFGNKRDIYVSSLHRYADAKHAQREQLMESVVDGRTLLRMLLEATLDEQWEHPRRRACFGIGACLDEGADDPDIRSWLERNASIVDEAITEVIRRGQADGSLRDDRPAAELARVVHAFLDGLQVRTRIRPSREAQRQDVESALSLL